MPNDGMVSMLDRWEQQGNPFAVTPRKKKATENDGGPGSGNFGHSGREGKVGGSSASSEAKTATPKISDNESGAVRYWKEGNSGYGYADIRSIANGHPAPTVTKLRDKDLGEIADHYEKKLKEIEHDFSSAVSKAPSADGKSLVRVTANYNAPSVGDSVTFGKYTSFSSEPNDLLYERFSYPGTVVYNLTGTSNFKDISKIGDATTDSENEVVNEKASSFKVASVKECVIGGEETWLGTVGGHKVTLVTLERDNNDGGPGSGNFGHEGRPGKIGGAAKGEGSSNESAAKESGASKLKSMSDNDFQKSTGYSKKNPDSAKVAYTLADKGFQPKEIKEASSLFDRHSLGNEPQKNADNEISAHIKDEDAIGRLMLDKSEIEEKALRDSGTTEFYRKGALDKDVLAFTDDPEGATMPTGENGELEHIGWDVNVSLDELLAKGYRPIAGGNCADVGSPSEKEILFAKFPDASSYEDLASIRSKESEAAKEYSKSYKSLIPENSYFNDPSYDNDSKKFTDCNKVIDDTMKIVKDLEKRIATEGVIKPRSEWTEEDEVDAMFGNPPMKYPEKVEGYKMAKDSILTSLDNVEKDRDAANERMQRAKQKAHDEQIKSVSFDKPVKASSDDYEGFTTKTTGTGYDEYLNGKQSGGYIAEMSPAEYLKRCAYQVFENATIESTLAAINEKNVDEYAKKMESGEKFDMPYLNLKKGEQEGRHRAAAAMKAGIEKIPVLIVGYKQNADSTDTHGSVGVLVINDGQILCGIRSGNTAPGCICGPGGHIENGETPEQAAIRETQEEFGITPKDLVPIGNGPAESDTGYSPNLFLCTDYEGEPNCTSNEMSWAQFVDLDRFANNPPSMFQPFADSIICLLNAMSLDDHEDGVFFAGELDDHAEGHDQDDDFFE